MMNAGIVHAGSLSHCHGLQGHLNRVEPLFMSIVTSAPFWLWQVKMSADVTEVIKTSRTACATTAIPLLLHLAIRGLLLLWLKATITTSSAGSINLNYIKKERLLIFTINSECYSAAFIHMSRSTMINIINSNRQNKQEKYVVKKIKKIKAAWNNLKKLK